MNDFYGYIAAFVGAISIGSYGVPIKAITLDIPNVHPFVIQTYKTCVFFITSWIVYFFFKQLEKDEQQVNNNNNKISTSSSIDFTYWGFLSGFLFVTGGTCGIYAIRNAGIAVAVGTWASIIVCVNFTWGILIFNEPIKSFWESCIAFVLLLSGLVGMSKYSSPPSSLLSTTTTNTNNDSSSTATDEEIVELIETTPLKKMKKNIEQEQPVISPILTNRNNVTMSRVSSISSLKDDVNGNDDFDDDTVGLVAKEEIDKKKKEVRRNDNIIFYYGGTTTTAATAASII